MGGCNASGSFRSKSEQESCKTFMFAIESQLGKPVLKETTFLRLYVASERFNGTFLFGDELIMRLKTGAANSFRLRVSQTMESFL